MPRKKLEGQPIEGFGRLARGSMRKAVWREPHADDAAEFLNTLANTDRQLLLRAPQHIAYYLDITMEKALEFFSLWYQKQP